MGCRGFNKHKQGIAPGSVFLTQADDAGTWSSDYLSVITGNISQLKFLLSEHTADAKTCVSASNMFTDVIAAEVFTPRTSFGDQAAENRSLYTRLYDGGIL